MSNIYEIIGRQVEKRNKRYFEELKDEVGYRQPLLRDLNKLREVREIFCEVQNIPLEDVLSKGYSRYVSWNKLKFIAVCYKLYAPETLIEGATSGNIPKLNAALAPVTGVNPKKIGEKSRKSLFSYWHYRFFREVVDEICSRVINKLQITE